MPERIQLSRRKGWRMPPNTKKVDRGTRWGNPFRIGSEEIPDAETSVRLFEAWLTGSPEGIEIAENAKRELAGINLACWCRLDAPCHAAVLLKAANS